MATERTTIDIAADLARGIAVDVRYVGDQMIPEDQGELLRMLRNVRLFLTPETPRDRTTLPVDSPSFG
jgi:hypothetical protein